MEGLVPCRVRAKDGVARFRKKGAVLRKRGRHVGMVDEVLPLMRVIAVIIKLFRAIAVVNVAVVLRTYAVIPGAKAGARHVRPICLGVR